MTSRFFIFLCYTYNIFKKPHQPCNIGWWGETTWIKNKTKITEKCGGLWLDKKIPPVVTEVFNLWGIKTIQWLIYQAILNQSTLSRTSVEFLRYRLSHTATNRLKLAENNRESHHISYIKKPSHLVSFGRAQIIQNQTHTESA